MIWFFFITSAICALVGLLFVLSPQQMLFLMSDAEKRCLMECSYYPVIARVGSVLLLCLCTPLNLIVGLLLAGLLARW